MELDSAEEKTKKRRGGSTLIKVIAGLTATAIIGLGIAYALGSTTDLLSDNKDCHVTMSQDGNEISFTERLYGQHNILKIQQDSGVLTFYDLNNDFKVDSFVAENSRSIMDQALIKTYYRFDELQKPDSIYSQVDRLDTLVDLEGAKRLADLPGWAQSKFEAGLQAIGCTYR